MRINLSTVAFVALLPLLLPSPRLFLLPSLTLFSSILSNYNRPHAMNSKVIFPYDDLYTNWNIQCISQWSPLLFHLDSIMTGQN